MLSLTNLIHFLPYPFSAYNNHKFFFYIKIYNYIYHSGSLEVVKDCGIDCFEWLL